MIKTKPDKEIIKEYYCKNCNNILIGHHYGARECDSCNKIIGWEKVIYCDEKNNKHFCKECYNKKNE